MACWGAGGERTRRNMWRMIVEAGYDAGWADEGQGEYERTLLA